MLGAQGKITDKNLRELNLDSLIKDLFEYGKPIVGICLGMQMAVIEAARNLGKIENANSEGRPRSSYRAVWTAKR